MKRSGKLFHLLGLAIMITVSFTFSSCDEDEPEPKEALITAFALINAGGTGDTRVDGVIEGTNILVVVPYETDVTALTTDITLSEGASVVPASGTAVDFTDPRSFVVTNGDISTTYQVTVDLAEPTSGVITDITITSASSAEEYEVEINQGDRIITVTFNDLQSTRGVISDITLLPAGTTYTTSSGNDTLDLTTDPTITLSFAGAQTVYTIDANVTAAGFNPENTSVLLNKSLGANLLPAIIDNENNRGAAFDGQYVYITSRKDGNFVYIWDVENPTADPITLTLPEIVSGGTWLVSDIRVVEGNIYLSNMVMADAQVFKIYKWEGMEDDTPEVILEYTVSGEGVRLGDAISIIGNPPANGYIFASNFAFPNNASEFYVWNFNESATPAVSIMPIDPLLALRMGQYGRVNTIPGEDNLLLVTGAEMGAAIMNYNGEIQVEIPEPSVQSRSYDLRIFEYNGGRYMGFVVNREWESQAAWYEIINITEGATVVEALQAINSSNIEEKRVFKHVFGGASSVWVGATFGIGFSEDGKPRAMGFGIKNGFIVHEFSN